MRQLLRRLGLAGWLLLVAAYPLQAGHAATHTVGPPGQGPRLAEVLRQAQDGDVIEVLPGTYVQETAVVLQRRLTIRGRGGQPVFVAPPKLAEHKAILVLRDGDITIENLAFRGARVPDRNGAGIRFENGRLTVRGCRFSDNEMGILTGNEEGAELRVEDSEFGDAPRDTTSHHHLLYAGRIGLLQVRGSHFHGGHHAHLIKSRARRSWIAYNLIADGPDGRAAYEVDLPNGGLATLIGNVVQQSRTTTNAALISFGAEGQPWPDSALQLVHNTLVSDGPGQLLRVWADRLPATTAVLALNNLAVGPVLLAPGSPGRFEGNQTAEASLLQAPGRLDFALRPDAPLRGRGVASRPSGGTGTVPDAEFRAPLGTRPLTPPAAWTPGAFQR